MGLTGRCYCGDVKYAFAGTPGLTSLRRGIGPEDDFHLTKHTPTTFTSIALVPG